MTATRPIKVVFLGTYSLHPRQTLLLESLSTSPEWEITECRFDPWGSVADKTQVKGLLPRLILLLKLLIAYPILALRYLRLPSHDLVIMMHAGLLDVLLLGGWVKLRKTPLVWDVYISVFDTLVHDRQRMQADSLLGRLVHGLEKKAAKSADLLFLDTRAHAASFEQEYSLPEKSVRTVYVGVDSEFVRLLSETEKPIKPSGPLQLLFYGNFIPLHGIDTIIDAMAELKKSGHKAELTLVGDGQTAPAIEQQIIDLGLTNIHRIKRLPYEDLIKAILRADICLGIFGTSDKAQRVIPNKVFQIAAAGIPFVTADTPAMAEFLSLATTPLPCELVPVGDPDALMNALLRLQDHQSSNGFIYGQEQVQLEITRLLMEVVSAS